MKSEKTTTEVKVESSQTSKMTFRTFVPREMMSLYVILPVSYIYILLYKYVFFPSSLMMFLLIQTMLIRP